MSEKEKAFEFINKFYCLENNSKSKIKVIELSTAKVCATILVEAIINEIESYRFNNDIEDSSPIEYLNRVRTEIKLA